eukprot:1996905-Rhodomonas_salina.1
MRQLEGAERAQLARLLSADDRTLKSSHVSTIGCPFAVESGAPSQSSRVPLRSQGSRSAHHRRLCYDDLRAPVRTVWSPFAGKSAATEMTLQGRDSCEESLTPSVRSRSKCASGSEIMIAMAGESVGWSSVDARQARRTLRTDASERARRCESEGAGQERRADQLQHEAA